MGAFVLLRLSEAPGIDEQRERALAAMARQHFAAPRRFEAAGCEIYLYDKLVAPQQNAYVDADGGFCLSVGTFLYRGATGPAALQAFHRDCAASAMPFDEMAGQFCLIVAKHGAVFLVTDRVGLFKVYRNGDASIITSSFLAAAAAGRGRTIDRQSVYEYVLMGAVFGNRTIFDEIELFDPEAMLALRGARVEAIDHAPIHPEFSRASFAQLLEHTSALLRGYFSALTRAFGDRISMGLSGGYDSRLMLALLRDSGVTPYLYVYGSDGDCDVRVARAIAAGEQLALHHTDKQAGGQLPEDQYRETVEENLHFSDGYPYAGIFDPGIDVRTRRERCRDGQLTLNGMAGELYRRPDLANRPFSALELVWRYFCFFDTAVCTDRFAGDAYSAAIAAKMMRTLRLHDEVLTRPSVSWTIPAFYARYWSGGTVSLNNRLSPALLPFCDLPIARDAVRLPIAFRYQGAFEAALIGAADARLAAYPSCYGHDFASPPPLERVVSEWRATMRSPLFWRFTGRPQSERPYHLTPAYVGRVLAADFPYLRSFFRLDRVHDAAQYNRICTLEYLFQKYSAWDN